MNIDLAHFITTGEMLGLSLGCSRGEILNVLGLPVIDTPQRKSMPQMLVYGDLEFRLRNDRLFAVTLSLEQGVPQLPVGLRLDSSCGFALERIKALLAKHDVGWKLDPIMSNISEDDAPVLVTSNHVHLAFRDSRLTRVGAALVR